MLLPNITLTLLSKLDIVNWNRAIFPLILICYRYLWEVLSVSPELTQNQSGIVDSGTGNNSTSTFPMSPEFAHPIPAAAVIDGCSQMVHNQFE